MIIIEGKMAVPTMRQFSGPDHSTIDLHKEDLPMSEDCKKALITKKSGIPSSPGKILLGGFLVMDHSFLSEAGVEAVNELARQTKRKFQLANIWESLAYKKSKLLHPNSWVVLGQLIAGRVLRWSSLSGGPKFNLSVWEDGWDDCYRILIVEEAD